LIATHPDILIYADLARWEIQQRYRSGLVGNLGVDNRTENARSNTSAATSSTGAPPTG